MAFVNVSVSNGVVTVQLDNNDWTNGTVGGNPISIGGTQSATIPPNGAVSIVLNASGVNFGNNSWILPLQGTSGVYFLVIQFSTTTLTASIMYNASPTTFQQNVQLLQGSAAIIPGATGFNAGNLNATFSGN